MLVCLAVLGMVVVVGLSGVWDGGGAPLVCVSLQGFAWRWCVFKCHDGLMLSMLVAFVVLPIVLTIEVEIG